MYKIFIIFFYFLFGSYNLPAQQKSIKVSIIQLISNPEKYHNQKILVSGFAHFKFEDNVLYLNKEAADYLMPESIWIDIDSNSKKLNVSQFDSKYIEIEGVFNSKETGHANCCRGTIEQIISIDKLKRWFK